MIKNQLKTAVLLGGLTGLFLLVGAAIGGKGGLLIALLFAGGLNFVSYWFSDKIVLMIYGAKEADKKQFAKLYSIIKELAQKADLPMPKVYIVNSPQANAFATGRNKNHAAVAVTAGILQILNEKELRGVLAHELSHIQNKDILIGSVAATIAGVISFIAMMARWAAIFGGAGGRDRRGSGFIEIIILGIITPILATIIQLAISRSREYLADESGAKLIKDSSALSSALQKIDRNITHFPLQKAGSTKATAHLFISNPFKASSFFNLLSTHPATEKRVARLKEMKF